MKFVLSILFIAIFATAFMAQNDDKIGVPLIIKKGETKKSGRLQIKYLGSLEDNRIHFEVTDTEENKTYEIKESYSFYINDLAVDIIEILEDDNAVKIVVLTKEMFGRKVLRKIEILPPNVADILVSYDSRIPIYANISIKKSVAEFSFFEMHSEKNDEEEFAEIFFKRIAVTNPKLNKIEMKMLSKKIGIVYQIKVSKQKYTVTFTHLGNEYEGVIELNSTVTRELKEVKFYRKAD